MARGYSDEADRLLDYLVSACMRLLLVLDWSV